MNYNILLGLTGSVASILYQKIINELESIANVSVVITEKTKPFIDISQINIPLYTDDSEWKNYTYKKNDPILHIDLVQKSDLFVIAPSSANTIAKIRFGLADNLLTSIALAWNYTKKPFIICPSMNTNMYLNSITQENLSALSQKGIHIIPPQSKSLACGDSGIGALCNIHEITNLIHYLKKENLNVNL